ncbi:MAG: DUF2897 family protein [Pseudomonadota bacterium]|jgi:hypothetical protein|nr:DUF2897 family protein [Pseudomonadota bacterium]
MNTWFIVGIIVLVLGVIVSNIMLLRYSAKFKLPPAYRVPEKNSQDDEQTPEAETTQHDNNKS